MTEQAGSMMKQNPWWYSNRFDMNRIDKKSLIMKIYPKLLNKHIFIIRIIYNII